MIFGKFERALVEPTARAKPSQPAEPGKRAGE
jgi:hypothetical protein